MVHLYFFENVTRDFNRLMSILLYTENHSKGAPVARVNELRPKDFTQRFQTLWSVNRGKSWTSAQRDIQQIFLRKQLLHLPLLLLYAKWALGMRSFLQLLQLLLRNLRSSGIIFEKLACQARQNTRLFFGEEFRYKTNDSSLMLKKTANFWTRENGSLWYYHAYLCKQAKPCYIGLSNHIASKRRE